MAGSGRHRDALQIIFAFFLGLMVTAFIGMGVYTFYPPDMDGFREHSTELRKEQQDLRRNRPDSELSDAQRSRLDELENELDEADDLRQRHQETWARNTSIIVVLLSTLVMGISLVRADQLPVISNGLLLGGVFTMLYGTGWTLASGTSLLRFWVMTFALLVTLGLGYVRFVRVRGARAVSPVPETTAHSDVQHLENRVLELERRLDAVGNALRGRSD